MTSTSGPVPVNDVDDVAGSNAPMLLSLSLEELNTIPATSDGSHSRVTSLGDVSEVLPLDLAGSPLQSSMESTTLQKKLLPVPAKKDDHGKPSFIFTEAKGGGGSGIGEFELPPEISNADLSIAVDGSFVQTTSGLAAQMLKKSYDKMLGVGQVEEGGQGVVRSPYAISAIQDEHGSTVYRVSRRQPNVATEDGPASDTFYGHATGSRRKTRLSVQDFFPAAMFKPAGESGRSIAPIASGSTSISPPIMSATSPLPRRKLRKTRSNSDLHLRMGNSPPSATSDATGHLSPPPRFETFSLEIRDELTAGADAFSQVLGWSSELASDPTPSSRKTSKASVPPPTEEVRSDYDTPAPALSTEGPLPRRPSVSTSAAFSNSGEASTAPFGEGVHYTAPLRQSAILLKTQQPQLREPQLREMQSFESGLTAKAGDDQITSSGTPRTKGRGEFIESIQNQARFETKVFDVLQTYRGLPLPSLLLSAPPTGATIKISVTDSANPKDDPRFVIWGEVQLEGAVVDDTSQSSRTDLSSSVSGQTPRKRSNARTPDTPHVSVSSEKIGETVIIAATVERWIAQLTSELNYEELLNFLLTYRTYISSVDLCHLLICRFHWALETPNSKQDEMVRRIIRLRTFIAIRYWILTFFREDFLPNPPLCRLFTTWLNTLSKDSHLKRHADALNIIRKLKKIVRECKAAHSRNGRPLTTSTDGATYSNVNGALGDLGTSGGRTPEGELDDADVDLDFSGNNTYYDSLSGKGAMSQPISFGEQFAPASSNSLSAAAGSQPSPNSILLSQPLSKAILGHLRATKPGAETAAPATLPIQHSAISRAFVNTMGKLGRWRRVLNSRSSVVATPPCNDMSVFDLDIHSRGDLLTVAGGVEEYMKMLNMQKPAVPALRPPSQLPTDFITTSGGTNDTEYPELPPGLNLSKHTSPNDSTSGIDHVDVESYNSHGSLLSSGLTDESDPPSTDVPSQAEWTPEIISLDDYNLSDSDSSSQPPVQPRKLPRRLPLRRDFQFVRRSVESASSMGVRSHSSVASSVKSGSIRTRNSQVSERESVAIGARQAPNIILEWPPVDFSDDEAEAGDAEAALRRLEGQIDMVRQREKEIKIGRWLESAARRNGLDSAPDQRESRASVQSDDQSSEANDEAENISNNLQLDKVGHEDVTVSVQPNPSTMTTVTSPEYMSAMDPTGTSNQQASADRQRSGSVGSSQAFPSATSRPTSTDARRPSLLGTAPRVTATSHFASPNIPPSHQSFILIYRSETLARQFTIIEAELLTRIEFRELISHQWGQVLEDVDVRDWVQFVKERARLKNTAKHPLDPATSAKLSAILALRARFDLLVNFVASEVLLTHSAERVALVAKFIRLAWKLYRHNNFGTLVAVIAGLQTRWVNQAMSRLWSKLDFFEQRLFEDLKRFTSRVGEFRFIREATAALVDARRLESPTQESSGSLSTTATNASLRSGNREISCVPFLGAYLAQLYEYEKLPDYIDPTAPSEPVLINHETGTLSTPAHPEVFFNLQPLPEELTLEPLINVHKQRLIADVFKSFIGGQQLAMKTRFSVDQKCYHKCFRLRSLDTDALQSISTMSSRPRRNVV